MGALTPEAGDVGDPLSDRDWVAEAVRLAVASVAEAGGPFAALVVRDGVVVASGQNRVTRDHDPTAHAEVVAIRAAGRVLGDHSLAGCVLYTSCEPCPLCAAAALWARVDRIVYAANRDDAARGGFDDRTFYDLFTRDRATWPTRVSELRVEGAEAPFEAWLANEARMPY